MSKSIQVLRGRLVKNNTQEQLVNQVSNNKRHSILLMMIRSKKFLEYVVIIRLN